MPCKGATTLPSFGEQEGRHLVLGVHPMLMVDTDSVAVERLLLTGELTCPQCGGVLAPWGHARWRSSRRESGSVRHRPRRASCTGCAKTHVLLPAVWLSRRADAASVIGEEPGVFRTVNLLGFMLPGFVGATSGRLHSG